MIALHVQDLIKTYKNGFAALKGVSFNVEQGDFFALLGPNGAGKTTLIGMVCGLINKTSGKLFVFGHDTDEEPGKAKACIGLVPQELNLYAFEKVEDIVVTQAGYYGLASKLAKERAQKYLKRLDLWDKRHLQTRMLSGGMKRRLMIARALVHEPALLILDEPTAGVDIEIRRATWDFLQEINQQGTTIILTTHYLEEAESLCRNIAIINNGQVIENTQMKLLLNKLHIETIILYLQSPMLTPVDLNGYIHRVVDDMTIEVDIQSTQNLSELFQILFMRGISVSRMKNKTNRLEELFMKLILKEKTNHDG